LCLSETFSQRTAAAYFSSIVVGPAAASGTHGRKRVSPIGFRSVGSPAIKGDETVDDFQQFVTDVTSRLSTMSKGELYAVGDGLDRD
jgi:hypothetical protein